MSNQITATMIKELRDRTGIGMGKCKEALQGANGDMELAIANLRKAGMASAVKKEGRATKEGMIGTASSGDTVAIVEINAETDFVIKNERFQDFLKNITEEVANTNPQSLESFLEQKYSKDQAITIQEYRAHIVQAIGENIQIKRLKTFKKSNDKSIGIYSHHGGKIVAIVEVNGSNAEETLAKELAMQVAAAHPDYVSPDTIPKEVIEHEKEIARSQMKGKPENIIEKILEGKLRSFFDQVCLLNQKFIKDDKKTIADLVSQHAKDGGKDLKVSSFIRWNVGQS